MEKETEDFPLTKNAYEIHSHEVVTPHREEPAKGWEIPKFYANGRALSKSEVVVTYKDHLKALKDQRERIAEKIDKERKPHPNKLEFKEGITRTVFRKRKNRTIAYNHGLDTALRIIQEEE